MIPEGPIDYQLEQSTCWRSDFVPVEDEVKDELELFRIMKTGSNIFEVLRFGR